MLDPHQVEELIGLVQSLDRDALTRQFENYQSTFPVDFTPQFLASLSLDRLRHIFLAVCLQSKRLPEVSAESAMESVA